MPSRRLAMGVVSSPAACRIFTYLGSCAGCMIVPVPHSAQSPSVLTLGHFGNPIICSAGKTVLSSCFHCAAKTGCADLIAGYGRQSSSPGILRPIVFYQRAAHTSELRTDATTPPVLPTTTNTSTD
jgi:hypothetical protein